jgi:hypothetical protein
MSRRSCRGTAAGVDALVVSSNVVMLERSLGVWLFSTRSKAAEIHWVVW